MAYGGRSVMDEYGKLLNESGDFKFDWRPYTRAVGDLAGFTLGANTLKVNLADVPSVANFSNDRFAEPSGFEAGLRY